MSMVFYGLCMDVTVLANNGVAPVNPRRAYVDDFALRIGNRTTLIPSPGGRAYGMLVALTHRELERSSAAKVHHKFARVLSKTFG
jgi:hypothetical protein